jgi:hypothetical protein
MAVVKFVTKCANHIKGFSNNIARDVCLISGTIKKYYTLPKNRAHSRSLPNELFKNYMRFFDFENASLD